MCGTEKYVQVILPLKLGWEPWYSVHNDAVVIGSRVNINLSGRRYVAVVSNISDQPGIDPGRVKPIDGIADSLDVITKEEIAFWRFLSEYYMCSTGEVYKYAHPQTRNRVDSRKARKTEIQDKTPVRALTFSQEQKQLFISILEAFDDSKPVFVNASYSEIKPVVGELTRRFASQGKDSLILTPEPAKESFELRRNRSAAVKSADPVTIVSGKSALFLPYAKLGLIVIMDEHDSRYKQSTISPRFNARDAAIALGKIHKSKVLLISATPSLETIYNTRCGKYEELALSGTSSSAKDFRIIDVSREKRKNGMKGSFSIKLLSCIDEVLLSGGRVLLMQPFRDNRDLEIEVRAIFPQARTKLCVESLDKCPDLGRFQLVALLRADYLVSDTDFRSDENSFKRILELRRSCNNSLLIQTASSEHRIWRFLSNPTDAYTELLKERRDFNLPPFSRLLDIRFTDANQNRLSKMLNEYGKVLGTITQSLPVPQGGFRVSISRSADLSGIKGRIRESVESFEKRFKYSGRIFIDVDPQ